LVSASGFFVWGNSTSALSNQMPRHASLSLLANLLLAINELLHAYGQIDTTKECGLAWSLRMPTRLFNFLQKSG
jgi:hypothetical protein